MFLSYPTHTVICIVGYSDPSVTKIRQCNSHFFLFNAGLTTTYPKYGTFTNIGIFSWTLKYKMRVTGIYV